MVKKILGFILIFLALILTLAFIGQLSKLLAVWAQFLALFSGNFDAEQAGNVTGQAIYWLFHIGLTFVFWKYGIRWARRPVKVS